MLSTSVRFGRFELQLHERQLLVEGQPAALGARAFDLLVALVAQPGQLVTKSALLDQVWPGVVVEEANLTVQVSSLRKVLGGELIATIPGRGYRFTGRAEPARRAAADERPHVLAQEPAPPLAPALSAPELIGRDEDLTQLSEVLSRPGCFTLVGPSGVGKTSLARALAASAEPGAVWVDLAAQSDGAQVLAAVARVLGIGVPEREAVAPALLRALRGRLLVLDNAEHVIDAAAAIAASLRDADRSFRMLATSQVPLAVAGERVFRLEPLALPLDDDELDLHRGAVALFVERARAADHRFRPGVEQLPLLRQICRRLDGLPLALEMAAARVSALGLVRLAQALERPLALLNAGRRDAAARHRTLQAALDWSHDLLSDAERRLYRTCGAFSGGFTLELLVQVAVPQASQAGGSTLDDERNWDVIDTLAQLVDRSLVAADTADPPRYRLLETMRADALQRLAASGEEAAVRDRHAHALHALAQSGVAPGAGDAERVPVLAEHDNLRESIAWALPREPELAVSTALAVSAAASFTAWRREALAWLESCEAAVEGGKVNASLRARWWRERSRQLMMNRDPLARAMAERACELLRALGDELGEFRARSNIVRASVAAGDHLEPQLRAMRELLARHPEWPPVDTLGLAGAEAWACTVNKDYEGMLRHRLREQELAYQQNHQGWADAAETNIIAALHLLGRHEEALSRSRALLARIADPLTGNAAYAWSGLLESLLALGRYDEFRAQAPAAARALRRNGLPYIGDKYALLLALEGKAEAAAHLVGFARRAFEDCGMAVDDASARHLQRAEQLVRQTLDAGTFAACVAAGRALDDAAADRLALEPGD